MSSALRDSAVRASWIASRQCAGSGRTGPPSFGPPCNHRHAACVCVIWERSRLRFWKISSIQEVGVGGPETGGTGFDTR